MNVSEMLTESMRLHGQAREARRLKAANARDLLAQARDLRVQAHAADPQHIDPAWMEFYAQQLGTI